MTIEEEKAEAESLSSQRRIVVKDGAFDSKAGESSPSRGRSKARARPQVMDGIFFVLRTGCQWKALDETRICSGSVVHARFQKWVQAGVFLRFWQEGLQEYDECPGIEWDWQSMDGAMTKAPLGGGKNGAQPYRSGQRWRQTKLVV